VTHRASPLLRISRLVAIAIALFFAVFAFDAVHRSMPSAAVARDVAVNLIPAALVATVIVAGWRRPWLTGAGLVTLALVYAVWARARLDWVVVISGPLFAAGLAFIASWRYRAGAHHS